MIWVHINENLGVRLFVSGGHSIEVISGNLFSKSFYVKNDGNLSSQGPGVYIISQGIGVAITS